LFPDFIGEFADVKDHGYDDPQDWDLETDEKLKRYLFEKFIFPLTLLVA
jgi:hypothetical protein